jgi:uncharacterized protein (DUF1778 family)
MTAAMVLDMPRKPAKPVKAKETMPVRVSVDALHWVRIACAFTSESVPDFISRVCMSEAQTIAKREAKKLGD